MQFRRREVTDDDLDLLCAQKQEVLALKNRQLERDGVVYDPVLKEMVEAIREPKDEK